MISKIQNAVMEVHSYWAESRDFEEAYYVVVTFTDLSTLTFQLELIDVGYSGQTLNITNIWSAFGVIAESLLTLMINISAEPSDYVESPTYPDLNLIDWEDLLGISFV